VIWDSTCLVVFYERSSGKTNILLSVQNLNEPKDLSVACGKDISPMRILTLG
jgi:hypothetical protein